MSITTTKEKRNEKTTLWTHIREIPQHIKGSLEMPRVIDAAGKQHRWS